MLIFEILIKKILLFFIILLFIRYKNINFLYEKIFIVTILLWDINFCILMYTKIHNFIKKYTFLYYFLFYYRHLFFLKPIYFITIIIIINMIYSFFCFIDSSKFLQNLINLYFGYITIIFNFIMLNMPYIFHDSTKQDKFLNFEW